MEIYEIHRLGVLLDNAITYILEDLTNNGMSLEDAYKEMKKYLGTSMYELRKLGVAEDWEVEQFDEEREKGD